MKIRFIWPANILNYIPVVRKLGWRLEYGILKAKLLVRNFVKNTKFNIGINVCHNKE